MSDKSDIYPSGTVTFLFTDIEDGSVIAQEYPDKLSGIMERYNAVIKNAVESNDGKIFKITGVSFCCAFKNFRDALNAAADSQSLFYADENLRDFLKVRMGIHTGRAEWTGSDYNGYVTLAAVSRLMTAARGGQILASGNSFDPDYTKLPEGISYRDLGLKRLKDINEPVKIYHMVSGNLSSETPTPDIPDFRPNNLPLQLTSFIGRENELKNIKEILNSTRLLTLLGAGGTGKTRLSVQAGSELLDEFSYGVWFAELASVNDPSLILSKIAEALKLKAESSRDIGEVLTDFLRDKQLLLILDNCEHLIESCAGIAGDLLQACPEMKIIATSRETLKLPGETVFQVPALSLPESDSEIAGEPAEKYEAVRLFADRARSVKTDFHTDEHNAQVLINLCRKLDGIPLAIELAAARIGILTPEKIYERLDDRFSLLIKGSRTNLPRQQTLRAMIDWSYDLLSDKEKLMFARLSVFTGGWSLESAEHICSDDLIDEFEVIELLTNLINKSLVVSAESDGIIRFKMLETIRQYSYEKLDHVEHLYNKFNEYFLKVSSSVNRDSDHVSRMNFKKFIETEQGNIRSCIKWLLENNPGNSAGQILNFTEYLELKGYYIEAYEYLNKLIIVKGNKMDKDTATALMNAGYLASQLDDNKTAMEYVMKSMDYFRTAGDNVGIAESMSICGMILFLNGESEEAISYSENALKHLEGQNERTLTANIKGSLAAFKSGTNDPGEALKLMDEAAKIYREQSQTDQLAKMLSSKGALYYQQGDYENAAKCFAEGLPILKEIDDQSSVAATLYNMGNLYLALNKNAEAKEYFEKAMQLSKLYGYTGTYDRSNIKLGEIALMTEDYEKAKDIFESSLKSFDKNSEKLKLVLSLYGLSKYYFFTNNHKLSAEYFLLAEKISHEMNFHLSKLRRKENGEFSVTLKNILQSNEYDTMEKELEEMNIDSLVETALNMVI